MHPAGRTNGGTCLEVAAGLHDVVVDDDIFAVKLHLLGHVAEEPAHQCRQVDHVRGAVLLEDGARLLPVAAGRVR